MRHSAYGLSTCVYVLRTIIRISTAATAAAAAFYNLAAALKKHKVVPNAVVITVDFFSIAHPSKTAGLAKADARGVFAYNARLE